MATARYSALTEVQKRVPTKVAHTRQQISTFYNTNVFTNELMSNLLPGVVYNELKGATEQGSKISRMVADAVAAAMKNWATTRGATHYTHWFQPLTGATAEKHDAFFEPTDDGRAIEKFRGSALVQQEPDASSFPSGGIRNTFEARGYTAWDPSSPAFLMETDAGVTLCIPTVFVSYTGEALDYKTPILKTSAILDRAATEVCQLFDKNVTKVTPTLGVEQEYFLVDRALYNARPDLVLTGRTVFGHSPAKGQQLEDHYFGAIPTRAQAFMIDLEHEALKLGIPIKTRHNEVAPGQFECAPVFEEMNLAVDHNQLLMDLMEKVAERHNLKALLHEKPFTGVNGSGKHNNWSLSTNTGKNLLSPSSKAKENLQFLTFFITVIKAVAEYDDLLRASIASASNDHRLGANEAPPAIMSIFIGSQLTAVLDELEKNASVTIDKGENVYLKLGINKVPAILLDNTDRNRTSPFAFTGNKFEFRAVGSSANNSSPMTVLNTIVANQLIKFKQEVDGLMKKGDKREMAIINILRRYVKESKKIRFEGNGYSDEWAKEAEKRGLSNANTTPEAFDFYTTEKAKKLFTDLNIFTSTELEARQEIRLENYVKKIQIESRVMGDLVYSHILPAAISYQNTLMSNLKSQKKLGLFDEKDSAVLDVVKAMNGHIQIIKRLTDDMVQARKDANSIEDMRDMAYAYLDIVKKYFGKIRYSVDKLELIIDDRIWPLVKYRELMFMK